MPSAAANPAPASALEPATPHTSQNWPNPHIDPSQLLLAGLQSSRFDWVQEGLARGADPNSFGSIASDREPMDLAIMVKDEVLQDILGAMLEAGGNPNAPATTTVTVFARACMRGSDKAVALMLSQSKVPIDLDARDVHGWLPSTSAAYQLKADTLQAMQTYFERHVLPTRMDLDRGHLWSALDNEGRNALFSACDNAASLTWLLNHRDLGLIEHLEHRDQYGRTVLFASVEIGDPLSVEILVGKGARVDVEDHEGRSIMAVATQKAHAADGSTSAPKHVRNEILGRLKAIYNAKQAADSIDATLLAAGFPLKPTH